MNEFTFYYYLEDVHLGARPHSVLLERNFSALALCQVAKKLPPG
jgi:hypothetical protein